MHTITVFTDASAELAIAALITAAAVLAGAVTRIVLCMLAVSAARKTLENLPCAQADASAIRAHRLAVLKAVLAALAPTTRADRVTRGRYR
ncbi:MAG TPA: hypothetical protein VGS19_20370 [Streptosporangiaceae bacterium]|nr:hypothetical protein [Streptosporangiaceae bacterium]